MKKITLYINILLLVMLLTSCNNESEINLDTNKTVQVIFKNNKYQLIRHGEPYFIKGASGTEHLELLKEIGGNSFRTYTTENAKELLDKADNLGLTVMLGIWVEPYSEYCDFKDTAQNNIILRFIKREVNRYKDHPALLMWGIGNEVHPVKPNADTWKFLAKACEMVKELDSNHPVTTSMAGYPRRNLSLMKYYLDDVNMAAFNTFGGIDEFKEKMKNPIWGYQKAYILTEWGYHGYWSVDSTNWNSPIEHFSGQKAQRFSEIWNKYITKDTLKCLGGYVFFWGQKQEYTRSWYSLFSKEGEKTNIVDSLSKVWSNKKINNYSPTLTEIKFNNSTDYSSLIVKPNSINKLELKYLDIENDSISISSDIRHETSMRIDDYGYEKEPLEIRNSIIKIENNIIEFKAPSDAGIYRIYIKISDTNKGCDMANIVFKVID